MILAIYLLVVACIAFYFLLSTPLSPMSAVLRASGIGPLWQALATQVASEFERRERQAELRRTLLYRSMYAGAALPDGYLAVRSDADRDNEIERYVKEAYRSVILAAFGNRCVKCNADTYLHLDHLWWPKARGGNLVMRHVEGAVPNVILLCRGCNSRKSDLDALQFFSSAELLAFAPAITALMERFRADAEIRRLLVVDSACAVQDRAASRRMTRRSRRAQESGCGTILLGVIAIAIWNCWPQPTKTRNEPTPPTKSPNAGSQALPRRTTTHVPAPGSNTIRQPTSSRSPSTGARDAEPSSPEPPKRDPSQSSVPATQPKAHVAVLSNLGARISPTTYSVRCRLKNVGGVPATNVRVDVFLVDLLGRTVARLTPNVPSTIEPGTVVPFHAIHEEREEIVDVIEGARVEVTLDP